jgi:hypothetical protein
MINGVDHALCFRLAETYKKYHKGKKVTNMKRKLQD